MRILHGSLTAGLLLVSSHTYPGYTGYELEVVVLRDSNDREYGVVFRSREKLQ